MPRLSDISRPELVTETFTVHGEQVTVTFDRSKINLHWGRFAMDSDTLHEALAEVIQTWDIVNDDGTPFPPVAGNIEKVPLPVISALSEALRDSSVPSEAEGKNSSGPPSTQSVASTEPAATPQNGPAISSLPVS